ncbi:MAG: FHA domain-containing protein [Lachnospiraceae bacterium]|nr:FHA domain-containing protein [Lachnospiraceae bacterium]
MAIVFAVGALCKYAFGGNDIFWLWLCVGCFVFASVNIVSEYAKEQQEQEIDVSMIQYAEEKNVCTLKNSYRLVPLNNGAVEPIEINNMEVKIGRSKEDADYRLKKSQISRVHARVFVESGKLYVVDEDSTNGTFVNNVRVTAHVLNNVKIGDVVAFATEEYFVA